MTSNLSESERQFLSAQIATMRPWHHDIQITDDLSTGEIFSETRTLSGKENGGVSLISTRNSFLKKIDALYPDSMQGKRFLDCACNAGGYCFWAREREVELAIGFDVREHWIDQARFVQKYRKAGPVDRIDFHLMDLYDLPKHNFPHVDMTYFSGIFYHLPDPITGLKLAADLTDDIFVLNTAALIDENNPTGLTMNYESQTEVMSGVHKLAWFPNGPECLFELLRWLGFTEMKVTRFKRQSDAGHARIEMIASRESGRLKNIPGDIFRK